jgi:broad specificity phosphatase PhoE
MADALSIRLLRHGETSSYERDAGLTETGLRQARGRAEQLAADCDADAVFAFAYAPTERARATAWAVHDRFVEEASRLGKYPHVSEPSLDERFRNLAVQVGDRMLEPTQARSLITPAQNGKPVEGWMMEAERFWREHDAVGDAMGFWLQIPLLWHEAPAEVVRRIITAAADCARTMHDTDTLVVTSHSGCMRAVIAWASGVDPGEPQQAEQVILTADPDGDELSVGYLGECWRVRRPAGSSP